MDKARAELIDKREIEIEVQSAAELAIHKKRQKEWGLGSHSGTYANHVYQLFNDPDFALAVSSLRIQFEKLYYKNVSLTTGNTDEHLLLEDKQLLKDFADDYCITLEDLGLFADGEYQAGYEFGKDMDEFGGLLLHNSPYLMNYVIGPKTSLEEIISQWPYIRAWRETIYGKEKSKSKSPLNPDLIYAIFKARKWSKMKFSEIYDLYEKGELEGYTGKSKTQFSSEDSLERYYRKYAPKPKQNLIELPRWP